MESKIRIPIVKIDNDIYNPLNKCRLGQINYTNHLYFYNYRIKVVIVLSNHESVHMGFFHGNKDNFAVFTHIYYDGQLIGVTFPYDETVFLHIKKVINYSNTTVEQFFHEFDQIYNHTHATTDLNTDSIIPDNDWVFLHLNQLSKPYIGYRWMSVIWSYLYLAMISEYKYRSTRGYTSILKKKMKMIGICQLLLGHMSPHDASQFSRNCPAYQLKDIYRNWVRILKRLFKYQNTHVKATN